jgi:EmrB/QacA subfamily drug resistance transporter
MIVLDQTIVNVALPAIQRDLGFSQNSLAWVVNAYMLTFGGFLLLTGRAADLLGRRVVLMSGLALFTLASLACGLAGSQTMLVVARAVQGVGGAAVQAVSLSIIVTLFPEPAERAKAMGVWTFVAAGGGTAGVLLGGILTQVLSWHWIFLINVPVGAAAVALARPLLPATPGLGLEKGVDVGGALAVTAAPVLAVYAIVQTNQYGWVSVQTLGMLALALVIAAVFVAIERRTAAPLVPLRIFHSRTIAVANAVIALFVASFFGWFFFAPLYMQRILNFTSFQTGASFLPVSLTIGILSIGVAARIIERYGARTPLLVGTALSGLGFLLFARAPIDGNFVVDVLPPMLLLGFGAGISFMPIILIAVSDSDPADSGLVSGLMSTSQMIGGAVGLAVLASLAVARTATLSGGGPVSPAALNGGYHAVFLAAAAMALLASLLTGFLLRSTEPSAQLAVEEQAAVAA